MATRIQVTFDCAEPARLARFWASALNYQLEDPPAGHDTWATYWRSIGIPEDEIDEEPESAVDPDGVGPRIWFQQVPEPKTIKNRVHLDLGSSCGASSVRSRLDGFSIVAGHEYSEAVTDPMPASGWVDSRGEENADKCAWMHLHAITLATGTFAVQPTWSNKIHGCAG